MMIRYSFPRSMVQLIVAILILLGGAWLASQVSGSSEMSTTVPSKEMAKIAPPPAGHIRLVVNGVRHNYGKIVIFEFDDADAWNAQNFDAVSGYHAVDARTGKMIVDLPVSDGRKRAWSLFHDENEDENLNADGGYPLEAFGSSGASSAMDEPSFSQAASDAQIIETTLFYPY